MIAALKIIEHIAQQKRTQNKYRLLYSTSITTYIDNAIIKSRLCTFTFLQGEHVNLRKYLRKRAQANTMLQNRNISNASLILVPK